MDDDLATREGGSHVTRSAGAPVEFDIPVFPDFLDEDDITPLSPISRDIDNLGSCPCCSQNLTVSLVHHNTGLITCNNLDVSIRSRERLRALVPFVFSSHFETRHDAALHD